MSTLSNTVSTKPRKHKFVTQCLEAGETTLTVWPEPHELANETAKKRFLESIAKISNDPRVIKVENSQEHEYGFVFNIRKR